MFAYFLRRILQIIPIVLGITLIVFVLLRVTGDPVTLLLPLDASDAQISALRSKLGLDKPLYQQYAYYLGNLVQGDFGASIRYRNQDAFGLVIERLPATLELTGAALLIAVLLSLPTGIIAAVNRNRWPDQVATVFSVLGQAMPNFWVGIMLILVFAERLRWLPASGRGGLDNLILPALALGTSLAALLMRLMRSSLLEVLNQDYVRTARAKGLVETRVLTKHALRNALLSYVTVLGLNFAGLMAGAVVTEQVFAWPGIGQLTVQAIASRDMAIVQTVVIVASVTVMSVNVLVDLCYALIDPRISYS